MVNVGERKEGAYLNHRETQTFPRQGANRLLFSYPDASQRWKRLCVDISRTLSIVSAGSEVPIVHSYEILIPVAIH